MNQNFQKRRWLFSNPEQSRAKARKIFSERTETQEVVHCFRNNRAFFRSKYVKSQQCLEGFEKIYFNPAQVSLKILNHLGNEGSNTTPNFLM